MVIHTSTRKSRFLVVGQSIVRRIVAFAGVFTPDVPECQNAECHGGERPPVAANDRYAVVVDDDDDESADDCDRVW